MSKLTTFKTGDDQAINDFLGKNFGAEMYIFPEVTIFKTTTDEESALSKKVLALKAIIDGYNTEIGKSLLNIAIAKEELSKGQVINPDEPLPEGTIDYSSQLEINEAYISKITGEIKTIQSVIAELVNPTIVI